MGNTSQKEGEDQGEDKEKDKEKDNGEEEEEPEEEAKEKEEEVVDEELPLGVDELLASGDPVLDLSNYKFRHLPRQVLGLAYLEKLYMCGNRLRTVPDGVAQLHGLRTLALDFNKLDDVPLAVCQLANLTHLYLGSNRLMGLPQDFRNLQSLRCLWVESNYFQHFPKQLYELPNLRSLQIGDNKLRTLPSDLWRMEGLRGLWLYGNRFQEFPPVLLKMEHLEILDLDRNNISHIPSLVHLPALRLFSYDHNPVKGPPRFGEDTLIVGEGAAEALEERQRKKEEKEQEIREAEEAAAAAAEAPKPAIQGILKKLRIGKLLADSINAKTNGTVPLAPPGEEVEKVQCKAERVDSEIHTMVFDEDELEYEKGIDYERQHLIYDDGGYIDYRRADLEYDRTETCYEYEGEEHQTGRT
ncbi:leucine-rich repeat-containing protein 10B [Trichomycterus rosablanca]|uniref:leucine-rich repeat-containing protein 10B n=1 Tax=Trichomycterus rosablanca TaxID=2290929 RepID=UPI002F3608C5